MNFGVPVTTGATVVLGNAQLPRARLTAPNYRFRDLLVDLHGSRPPSQFLPHRGRRRLLLVENEARCTACDAIIASKVSQ